jgi:hypothetical protein
MTDRIWTDLPNKKCTPQLFIEAEKWVIENRRVHPFTGNLEEEITYYDYETDSIKKQIKMTQAKESFDPQSDLESFAKTYCKYLEGICIKMEMSSNDLCYKQFTVFTKYPLNMILQMAKYFEQEKLATIYPHDDRYLVSINMFARKINFEYAKEIN